MTPIEEDITALEKALEAGPTQEWKAATEPNGRSNGWRAGPDAWLGVSAYSKETAAAAAFIAAANPLAIRTLLDAHAGALRDAAKLREALTELSNFYGHVWDLVNGDLILFKGSIPRYEAAQAKARAALATNTKAQP